MLYPLVHPVCYGNRKVHDEFTHLGPSKDCHTCKMANMKEKTYIRKYAVSKEERDSMRVKREELKFNTHLSMDSFGPVPKDINGNDQGMIGLCSNTGFIYFRTRHRERWITWKAS